MGTCNLGGTESVPGAANVLSGWGISGVDPRRSAPRNFLIVRLVFGRHTRGFAEDSSPLSSKANKELPPQLLSLLLQRNMPERSPILVRIFKEESELEVWKHGYQRAFRVAQGLPDLPLVRRSRPKITEGDRQAPEGFYTITPGLINPNSNYYLAINTGFPNAYDRANDRHGGFLMIHGDCSSRGCYAMTDEQIGEIYSLRRKSFLGGQPSFQIQAYPFRMTPAKLARHRTSPHLAFWKMLKIGNDHFEATHLEPKVDVCDKHYGLTRSNHPVDRRRLHSIRSANAPLLWSTRKSLGPR